MEWDLDGPRLLPRSHLLVAQAAHHRLQAGLGIDAIRYFTLAQVLQGPVLLLGVDRQIMHQHMFRCFPEALEDRSQVGRHVLKGASGHEDRGRFAAGHGRALHKAQAPGAALHGDFVTQFYRFGQLCDRPGQVGGIVDVLLERVKKMPHAATEFEQRCVLAEQAVEPKLQRIVDIVKPGVELGLLGSFVFGF